MLLSIVEVSGRALAGREALTACASPPLGEAARFRYSAQDPDPAKEVFALATPHFTLTQVAQQAAAQLGFTARRWWRAKAAPAVLRVEVERRLVGAPPTLAVLTVALPSRITPHTPHAGFASCTLPIADTPHTAGRRHAPHDAATEPLSDQSRSGALPATARTRVSARKAGEALGRAGAVAATISPRI